MKPLPSGELLISSSDVHLVQPSKCIWTMEEEIPSSEQRSWEHDISDGRLVVPAIPPHRSVGIVLDITKWSEEEALVRIDYRSGPFSHSAWHTVVLSPKFQCRFDRIANLFRCIMWGTSKGLVEIAETWIIHENEDTVSKTAVMQHNMVLSSLLEHLSNIPGVRTSNQTD